MRIKRLVPVTALIKKAAPVRMVEVLPVVRAARIKPSTVFKEVRPWA